MGRRVTVFTPEIRKFIEENHMGRTSTELAEMVNEKFGLDKKSHQIRRYKSEIGLKSGMPNGSPIFSPEVRKFIDDNHNGKGYQAMVDLLQEKFGVECTATQIRNYYKNHKMKCGVDTRWKKGVRISNGIERGTYSPGCEKGFFKKGSKPVSWCPPGTERVRKNGYIWVKMDEHKTWKQKHLIVWEEANGPVPEGHQILFRDGNRQNCDLSNLMLIDMKLRGPLNYSGLANVGEEYIDTAIKLAEMTMAINDAKRRKQ